MRVTCEHCGAQYKLDQQQIVGRGVRITCPTCSHVFTVYRSALEIQEAEAAADGDSSATQTLDVSAESAENLTVKSVSESTQSAEIPEEFTVELPDDSAAQPSLTSERAGSETEIEVSLDLDVDVDFDQLFEQLDQEGGAQVEAPKDDASSSEAQESEPDVEEPSAVVNEPDAVESPSVNEESHSEPLAESSASEISEATVSAAELEEPAPTQTAVEELNALPDVTEEAVAELSVHELDFRKVSISWRAKTMPLGLEYSIPDFRTLQRYMRENKVKPSDLLSPDGESWVKIEEIGDLEHHFCREYLRRLREDVSDVATEDVVELPTSPSEPKVIKERVYQNETGIDGLADALAAATAEVDGTTPSRPVASPSRPRTRKSLHHRQRARAPVFH